MDTPIAVSFTPLQMILSLAFQVWIVVFPIIIIRKLNHLTALLDAKNNNEEQSDENEDQSN